MATADRCDLLFVVVGTPHESDMTTTLMRLLHASLDLGGRVQVWTCGYATMLTQRSLGEGKPRNLVAWSQHYPSTATLVADLVNEREGRLGWYVCRFCSEERGATEHIPEAQVRPALKFANHVTSARKTVFMGVI